MTPAFDLKLPSIVKRFSLACAINLLVASIAIAEYPARQTVFTYPNAAYEASHLGKLEELIDATVPGAEMWISIYLFNHTRIRDALIRAGNRGAVYNIIMTPGSRGSGQAAIENDLRLFGHRTWDERRVHRFENAMGSKINHNKFALFSHIEKDGEAARFVVFQSSGNFTTSSLRKAQNTVVLVDRDLFQGFLKYWYDQLNYGLNNRDDNNYRTEVLGDDRTNKAYFFPRSSGDTITGILSNYDLENCNLTNPIRVAMARWTRARLNIARALGNLRRRGCRVEVVLRPTTVDQVVIDQLRADGISIWALPSLHSKYFLLEGVYGRTVHYDQRLVWTGSPNFTRSGLRSNDEALLKIRAPSVFAAFLEDFERLKRIGVRTTPTTPPF